MSALLLFGVLIGLILLGLPICFCIAYSGIVFLGVTQLKPMVLIAQRALNGMDSYTLLAIPLFTLAGYIMDKGGLSRRLVHFVESNCSWIPGGIGTVTILCCGVFAALTGSGPATVAAIGAVMYPAMTKAGYRREVASGLLAAGGALGPVIPPSIPMIVYGTTMMVSVPAMFMGAIIPGLFLALVLILINFFMTRKEFTSRERKQYTGREKWKSFRSAFGVLLLPVIVLGGIYGGAFTPTEAAAICVCFSVFLGLCYRELNLKSFVDSLVKTVETSSMVIVIVGMSSILGWILSATGIPAQIAGAVVPYIRNQYVYLLLLLAILFVIGCMMETVASMLILAPILVPIGIELGLDPLHLAITFCIALVVGFVTPPFGVNLFAASAATGASFTEVVKGALPYIIGSMAAVLVIAFIPELTLFLPKVMGMVW